MNKALRQWFIIIPNRELVETRCIFYLYLYLFILDNSKHHSAKTI